MKKKILLFTLTTILSLVLLEVFFQFKPMKFDFYNADGWWKEMWLADRKHRPSQITIHSIDKFHPTLGWTLKENLSLIDQRGNRLTSNSKGIRGNKEFDQKKPETTRILTIGDSFAFGECVADNETYSSYLEQVNESLETINLGNHGYGTDQQLLKLQNQGLSYNPDIIILGLVNEDLERNKLSFRDFAKPRFVIKNNELLLSNTPLKSPEKYKKFPTLHTLNYLNIAATKLKDKLFSNMIKTQEEALSKKLLEEIIKTSKSANADVYFLYLPDSLEILNNNPKPHPLYQKICQRQDLICINPNQRIQEFLKTKNNPSKYFDCHYSKEIHALIATELLEHINPNSSTSSAEPNSNLSNLEETNEN